MAVVVDGELREGDPRACAGETELLRRIEQTLVSSGHLDRTDTMVVAEDAEALLDDLQTHVAVGRADLARGPLRTALILLRDLLEDSDDDDGALGAAGQRAADLYARACVEGHPDRVELAVWLASFRAEGMTSPHLTLDAFAPAFDQLAFAAYRATVAEQHRQRAQRHTASRDAVDRMRVELADHDGEVGLAVTLLSRQDPRPYGAMLRRLDAAGRADQAALVVDVALASGLVDGLHTRWLDDDRWVHPGEAAFRYVEAGRPDDAICLLRRLFELEPGPESYLPLLGCARRVDAVEQHRDWALAVARQVAEQRGDGGLLVTVHLAEGDLGAALAVARELGPGSSRELLAKAATDTADQLGADVVAPWPARGLAERPRGAGRDDHSRPAPRAVLSALPAGVSRPDAEGDSRGGECAEEQWVRWVVGRHRRGDQQDERGG